mgnify:CR=1 FL=1
MRMWMAAALAAIAPLLAADAAEAMRITAADLRGLRDMARREREALRAGEQSAAIKLSAAFHERLARLSGNATLAEFVGQEHLLGAGKLLRAMTYCSYS